VELAESAPDRKTKVVACELLHSIVIVMIGKSAFQLSGQQQVSFNNCKEERYKLDTQICE
jgi:DNA-dependent protein kinase catalytic subunit